MSASEPIRSVVIVGNGVDGWTTAAALAQAFQGQQLEIQVLDQAPEALPVAEPAAPVCHAFHQHLGVDEAALMRECGGTFSLGMQFKHWVRDGHEYIEPMGPHGASIEYVHFHNFACKARQAGDATPFNDYSLCAVAARNGRFTHPSQDRSSILSTLFYVQHLDSDRYAAMMRTMALRLGALTIDGHLDGVERDGRGFVRSVRLSDGREIEGDLFIDCSGPAAALMRAVDTGFTDWSALLPANRIVSARGAAGALNPITTVKGLSHGWHQVIPLQDCTGHTLVYDSDELADEAAAEALRAAAGGELEADPVFAALTAGQLDQCFSGNCVALGGAAACFPPIDGAHLAMLHAGILRLITLFPDRDCHPSIAAEFNEVSGAEHRNVRDFLLLHFLGVERTEDFWTAHRTVEPPESLAYKINLFKEHGQVAFYEEESYPDTSWVSVWLGQDQWPKGYDPILDKYDFERLQTRFSTMRDIIRQAVETMPTHREYLERYCAQR